jgi:prevent-host-death family protein
MKQLRTTVKAPKHTTNVVSALTARTHFGQIMRRATEKNERFVVDRRGEPSVIIMSVKDYTDTIAPSPQWLLDAQANARRHGLDKLTMRDIDKVIAEVRSENRQRTDRTVK